MSLTRFRPAIAAVAVAAALVPAGVAQAAPADKCEGAVEQLETRFREIEEQRGYDAAVKWWDGAWRKYHDRCVI